MKLKKKEEDFLVCYQVHQVQAYQEIFQQVKGTNRAGEGIVRAGYGNEKGQKTTTKRQDYETKNAFLMPPHPLTNFKIQKYYLNGPRFNGVYSRDNLPKHSSTERNYVERSSAEIKDEAYIIDLDEDSNSGTHWIALYVQNNDVTYFDSIRVEYILKEIKNLLVIKT